MSTYSSYSSEPHSSSAVPRGQGFFSSSSGPDLASRHTNPPGTRTPRGHFWSPFLVPCDWGLRRRTIHCFCLHVAPSLLDAVLLGNRRCGCESVVDGRGGKRRLSRPLSLFAWPGCPSSIARKARFFSSPEVRRRLPSARNLDRGGFGSAPSWGLCSSLCLGIVPSALARSG